MAKFSQTWIGLGGTFDHFHAGHEHFLRFASKLGKPLKIGITTNKLVEDKPGSWEIESWSSRARQVAKFLDTLHVRYDFVKLTDAVGPAIDDPSIVGLAVTEDTVGGALHINRLRAKLKLRPLETYVSTVIPAADGKPISSRRIREGEISRTGVVYEESLKKLSTLSKDAHTFFSKPQGKVVTSPIHNSYTKICVVGDATLNTFISKNWLFDLAVYDKKSQRQPLITGETLTLQPDKVVENKAGTISVQLIEALQACLQSEKKLLFVNGEEDLATVALVLLLPFSSVVYYGQPNVGIVAIEVTEQKKEKFAEFLGIVR